MGQLRVEKIQEFIKQEASKIILSELKDPRIGFVTVTNVEVTNDLRNAKIYVSLLGNAQQNEATLQGLASASGFFRTEIGKRIRLRFTPSISFHLDQSFESSARIQKLLLELDRECGDKEPQTAREEG